MRQFTHPNTSHGWKCPVCKSNKDLPVVLVGIPGTESGGNMKAEQIHSECWKLFCSMNDIEHDVEPLDKT